MFSLDGTLISASAAPHCRRQSEQKLYTHSMDETTNSSVCDASSHYLIQMCKGKVQNIFFFLDVVHFLINERNKSTLLVFTNAAAYEKGKKSVS